ncbi:MAG: hypothetical protein NZ735_04960 [Candidatus Marinimicrobia bacterium]|nr:hypothetical protein [Candidatus Neomarinimicrobiota bacterium]
MKITEFTYNNPDSDGDISLEGSILLENKTDFDVEYITVSSTVLNHADVTVGGNRQEEDGEFITAKSSGEVDLNFGWNYHKDLFDGKPKKMKALVEVTMYKREFMKIGRIEVPASKNTLNMLKKDVSIGGMVEIRGVSVLRKEDDDEGDLQLEIRAGFRNISDTSMDRAQLNTKIMDQRDAEIDSDISYESMPSKSSWLCEPSFWSIKPGKVKNGEVVLSASIFVPIGTFTGEAIATPSKD